MAWVLSAGGTRGFLSERDDVEVAICDAVDQFRDETQSELHRAAQEYSDYGAALLDKPDLVLICTPNHLHVPMGLQALECGAALFVEKPLSDSLDEARKLVAAARERNAFLHVGYSLRLDDGLQEMKRVVDEGGIGNLVGGRALVGTYQTLLNAKSADRLYQEYSLVVDYTHELDYVRWFFGEVENVSAFEARLGAMELKPSPNIFQINLQMRSGALVHVHMDYIQFPQRRTFEIIGDKGTLEYDFMTGAIRHFQYGREHVWKNLDVTPPLERWDDLFRRQHDATLTSWRENTPPPVTGDDGLAALEIAERAITAAQAASKKI